jgi:hypothetical protein
VFADRWIYHTNKIDNLHEFHEEMRDSITLIVCDRANKFDTVLSNIIAIKTNEFYNYTDNIIEPFHVDPEYFKDLSRGHRYYLDQFNGEIVPIYNNIIRIEYNSVVGAAVPEQYIADQLGVACQVRPNYHHGSFKNPRKYKDLILNWEELHQIHQEWPVDQ